MTVTDDRTAVACPAVDTVGDNDSSFEPGEIITCTATYTVTPADLTAGNVTNTAKASAGGVDSNEDSVTVDKVTVVADLAVTKTSAPNPYVAGSQLTYTVEVTNNGPSPVVGAALSDAVPAALTGVTWDCAITTGSGACGSAAGTGNSISTTVDLASGSVATFTIRGTVNPATTGTLTNTATVTTPLGTLDPSPGNNVATDSNNAPAASADPTITITPGTSNVPPSAPLDFTVTVSNNASTAATGVAAVVSIPPGYGFVSATGSGSTCSLSVNLVICNLSGVLAANASAPPISLRLIGPSTTGQTTVTGSVTSTSADTNPGNNDASATVNVATSPPVTPPAEPQADLALAKTAASPDRHDRRPDRLYPHGDRTTAPTRPTRSSSSTRSRRVSRSSPPPATAGRARLRRTSSPACCPR